ncbi:MAG: DUF3108 domain-containing protein [Dehalococcoidia bacterium]|nr:DUF3108 domain-containing protein [Dehalococcoidia bacterium]
MRGPALLAPALLAALALLASCAGGDEDLVARAIVSQVPWTAPETAHYEITKDNDVQGACDLTVAEEQPDLVLTQDCRGGDFNDKVTMRVEPGTLKPRRVDRVIEGPKGAVQCQATYEGSAVKVVWTSGNDRREGSLDVASPSYDSWSDLFLWRTIAFSEGLEERYTDVGSCIQQRSEPKLVGVRLDVKGREQIEVPAGTFDVWRLEVRSEGHIQKAWYATGEGRVLVRYDNGSQVFELQSLD